VQVSDIDAEFLPLIYDIVKCFWSKDLPLQRGDVNDTLPYEMLPMLLFFVS
jgi:hypothetical protein